MTIPLDGVPPHGTVAAALQWAARQAGGRPVSTLDLLVALMRADSTGEWHRLWLHCGDADAIAAKPVQDPASEARGPWKGTPLTHTCAEALDVSRRLAERYGFSPLPAGILALGLVADDTSAASRALGQGLGRQDLLQLLQDAILGTTLSSLRTTLPKALAESAVVGEAAVAIPPHTPPPTPRHASTASRSSLPPGQYVPVRDEALLQFLEEGRRRRRRADKVWLCCCVVPLMIWLLAFLLAFAVAERS
ncbi:hypothetical protein [Streptomyces sasae]|uniref:hypothetical protein n=1 Tax=Streptomyces sasae TaxID=1266772 RepID=UPI00292EDA55|nr:hypothetical protein [Streptomyces sasae]